MLGTAVGPRHRWILVQELTGWASKGAWRMKATGVEPVSCQGGGSVGSAREPTRQLCLLLPAAAESKELA